MKLDKDAGWGTILLAIAFALLVNAAWFAGAIWLGVVVLRGLGVIP